MRWAAVLPRHPSHRDEDREDPHETLLAQLVTVRLLLSLGQETGLDEDEWQTVLAWLAIRVPEDRASSRHFDDFRPLLKAWLRDASASLEADAPIDCRLATLGDRIAQALKLDAPERDILLLAWLRLRHRPFNQVLVNLQASHIGKAITSLFGHDIETVHEALREDGRLKMLGLLGSNAHRFLDLEDALSGGHLLHKLSPLLSGPARGSEILTERVRERLMGLCPAQPAGRFTLDTFEGVPLRQLLVDYLERALKRGQAGANVLIHGQPGVGKTELVRTLASRLGVSLYGVPVAEEDHQPLSPAKRLGRYQVVQQLLDRHPALVMFDEIEDVMADEAALPKGWTNRLLEANPLPGVWVSNSVHWLDPAYLRRFDLIIEVRADTSDAARQRLRDQFEVLPVTTAARDRLAAQPWMTPALAGQLGRLGTLLDDRAPLRNEQHIETLLGERLRAQGQPPQGDICRAPRLTPSPTMPAYALDWLNTRPGLESIVSRLKRRERGRLCLHGLPGSGKTALAEHLAERLGRELIRVTASDLLDRYVGGTEAKIAECFQQAQERGAVLLLDEIDGLLTHRAGAQHQWEVTQTNELLVQLERFDGILLATTNRVDSLDRAVMRRFDLKVEFRPLAPEQLRSLLQAVLPRRDHARLASLPENHLASRRLTPGNLRTALDQLDLRGLPLRLNTLMEALGQEEREQHGNRQPVGFL